MLFSVKILSQNSFFLLKQTRTFASVKARAALMNL